MRANNARYTPDTLFALTDALANLKPWAARAANDIGYSGIPALIDEQLGHAVRGSVHKPARRHAPTPPRQTDR